MLRTTVWAGDPRVLLCWLVAKGLLRKTLSYTIGLTSRVFIVSFARQTFRKTQWV